jgi:hypothetical protein
MGLKKENGPIEDNRKYVFILTLCNLSEGSPALAVFRHHYLKSALIKKKIKFASYIRKFRGIGCKVIYD